MSVETEQGLKDAISPTLGQYHMQFIYVIDPTTNQLVSVRVEYVFP